ncbi:MAG: 3-deoxy-D-manno-octulosonic acid transferase [Nitrospirales bacterium]|nr:3-deoxy-D-manno-octulosonic acid transferase [Nitrospirales bacterium]
MYYWIYNGLLHLAFPIIAGLLLVKKRLQRGLKPRLGILDPACRQLSQPVIWVHAVSLGETTAVIPLLRVLKETWPQGTLVVSTITETGKEVVSAHLGGLAKHCYAPLDFPWVVNRFVRELNPFLYILVESEFWPNLLRRLHRNHVPICLVNGRISSRSYSRYRFVRPFIRRVLECLDLALVQTERDRKRMLELGASGEIVQVTGNMKFDQMPESYSSESGSLLSREALGIQPGEILWVAGSTHEHEEGDILEAYQAILPAHPRLVLLLAPRHIERTSHIEQVIRGYGIPCIRRSLIPTLKEPLAHIQGNRIILLDTRGELAGVYRLAVAGFVGGTLVPVGGHNVLEPAQWGRPVLFGPYTDHCRDFAMLLVKQGGGIQVQDSRALADEMKNLLADPQNTEEMGRRAFDAVRQGRGVVHVNLQKIREMVDRCYASSDNREKSSQTVSVASQSLVK